MQAGLIDIGNADVHSSNLDASCQDIRGTRPPIAGWIPPSKLISSTYLVRTVPVGPRRSDSGTQLFLRRWLFGAPCTFSTLPAEQEPLST